MTVDIDDYASQLVARGWTIVANENPLDLPVHIKARYGDVLPSHYLEFVRKFELVFAPKAWFVTSAVFAGATPVAFAWNEWERQSIEAAGEDAKLAENVAKFWDRHIPLVMSVKDCYAHFSLNLDGGAVVRGEEPDYEDVAPCATTLDDFLRLVISGALERWI